MLPHVSVDRELHRFSTGLLLLTLGWLSFSIGALPNCVVSCGLLDRLRVGFASLAFTFAMNFASLI